ncbi:MAG TPA: nucleotide exchange factor GrpE [Opitutaceae bacterium]|nr:nucleotide exchange factor GrpE [Opitutaceae bacterium]
MSQTTENETQADGPKPGETAPQAVPPPADGGDAQLAQARKEAVANHERYLRAVADLENFRKRAVREKEEVRQFGTAAVMEDIIPVIDNLGLGLAAAKQQADGKAITDGVSLVLEQFKATLARHGLKEVNPAGAAFDPHLHECIAHQPSPDVPAEHVMQVVRLGYTLNGRLLRPASVIVSSGPAQPAGKA